MNVVPHISNSDKWKKHFLDMAQDGNLANKKFYIIGKKQSGKGDAIVQMVTPTKQAMERAVAEVKKKTRKSKYKPKRNLTKSKSKKKKQQSVVTNSKVKTKASKLKKKKLKFSFN